MAAHNAESTSHLGKRIDMGKRINRAVELLADGQPVYYTGGHTSLAQTFATRPAGSLTGQHTPVLTYEQGQIDAATWADYINVGFEHGAFDLAGLDSYLHGMVDAGPTRSGHRTPAVIVEAPVNGISRAIVEANAWQFQQILARGVHGIILCKANTADAARAFVECCRFPVQRAGVGKGLGEGTRGFGAEISAGYVWGVDNDTYGAKADPWPLNPDGELILGIKIETTTAIDQLEDIVGVPGIAFAEVGPTDLGYALGIPALTVPLTGKVAEVEQRLKEACRASGVPFHPFTGHLGPDGIPGAIDEGGSYFTAPSEEIAIAGRAHTKRAMPV